MGFFSRLLEGGARVVAGAALIVTTPVAAVADVISAPFRGELSLPAARAVSSEAVRQLEEGTRKLVGGARPAPASGR